MVRSSIDVYRREKNSTRNTLAMKKAQRHSVINLSSMCDGEKHNMNMYKVYVVDSMFIFSLRKTTQMRNTIYVFIKKLLSSFKIT